MAKIYTIKNHPGSMNPRKETISFLLGYSKSIEVIKIKNEKFMFYLN